MTCSKRKSCLVEHDICNSSVPRMDQSHTWMMVVMASGLASS